MNPEDLKQVLEDAKAVKQQSLNNAKNALYQAFSVQTSFIGYSKKLNHDGTIRYTFETSEGVDLVYEEIEKDGYIILDEDENGDWIEVIKPEKLEENIKLESLTNQMANEVAAEIDKEIIEQITKAVEEQRKKKEEERLLKNRYYKFRSWMSNPPCPVDKANLPTFEQWKESEKNVQ